MMLCATARLGLVLLLVVAVLNVGVARERQEGGNKEPFTASRRCNWEADKGTTLQQQHDALPVYWINMAESATRRAYMIELLSSEAARAMGLGRNERVQSITPDVPDYRLSMLEMPCKRNTPRDLAVIMSHLTAMHRAVYESSTSVASKSKYALILEDDVAFTMPVRFTDLIRTAPADFGILQLTTSCKEAVHQIWRQFAKSDGQDLWTYNHWTNTTRDKRYPLFWSAQAYIINKAVVKGFLDDVIITQTNGSLSFKLVNSFFPRQCQRTRTRPCILANCLFSDSYIFAGGGPTYVSNVPIVNGADIGRSSTIHQEHVSRVHLPVFDLIRQTVDSLKDNYEKSGRALPPYVFKPKCPSDSSTLPQ